MRPIDDTWILLTNGTNLFDAEFRAGALAVARERGFPRIRLVSEHEGLDALLAPQILRRQRFGVLCHVHEPPLLKAIAKADLPCILLGQESEQQWRKTMRKPVTVCSVNNEAIGQMAADYLHGQGRYAAYAYVDGAYGPHVDWWTQRRYESFTATLREHGFTGKVPHLTFFGRSPRDDTRAFLDALADLPHPVAVFACNDRFAREVLTACELGGVLVPEDVAVLGVDDEVPVCEASPLTLSSIKIEHHRLGRTAMELMLHLIKTGQRRNTTILCPPVRVIERLSTRTLPPSDRFVARAVAFLRDTDSPTLDVPSVVRASGASRSYLEQRFRDETGKTILQAIHARRLEEVKRLLVDTVRSVSFIAAETGFRSLPALCVFFRRGTGLTPNAYRAARRVKGT